MTIHVTLESSQVDALIAELNRDDAFLSHLGEAIKAQTERRFSTKQGSTGSGWSPWSALYAKTRKGVDSLLIDRSTHKSGTPHLSESFDVRLAPHEVEVGTDVPYASTHQRGRRRIPARPFLGIGPQDVAGITSAIGAAFSEMVSRASVRGGA